MAKIRSNLVIHGLSGMLGKQVVVRQLKNGDYVMSAAPAHRNQTNMSEAQKQQQKRFRAAITYARGAQNAPEYQELAKSRGQSPMNVAVADFFHPPEIQAVDIAEYHGAPGQSITITAVDDVQVKTVGVLIATEDGTLVERGTAVRSDSDGNHWLYVTTATAPSSAVKIVVDAADLAGQVAEVTEHTQAASA